ncbi:uncharacterized protein LAESUDRAFT_694967 [Laetiporus sulphureus 93-53]|uniref:DAGKc domain-containing protein n=1 Tax=Laetiporus sulphureus 93-53 TaxID=1314785 RepID=A0A165FVD2_9APHY|nr:uncharacterized protein LAESUDRAFT_694967 [Laetiporus sulphureus 93-53]KZT09459.1 hypothetical protein LAESUDRAFT_694967 [Laetiporus sulphureus 93-53]
MTASPANLKLTIVGIENRTTTFTVEDGMLVVARPGEKKWPRIRTTLGHVLWAEVKGDSLEVSFLARRKSTSPLAVVRLTGTVQEAEADLASAFTESLMDAAYAGVKRQRKLKVFVNPKSGPGNGIVYYKKRIEPIFQAARCAVDPTFTDYPGHAQELIKELDLEQCDAVVVVSGDGLVHEVINGFAQHRDPEGAFRVPIAPVACGSGNGLPLNLLGPQDGYDVCAGALNAIKGKPMHIDLCSVTQKDKTVYSFMSQTVGLFADLDIGTEWLRFLGSTRFVVGFVIEVLKMKRCPVKLSIKVADSDKKQMVQKLHGYHAKARACTSPAEVPISAEDTAADDDSTTAPSSAPPLSPTDPKASSPLSPPDSEGWSTFVRPLSYVYAGKGPYVSRDLMQFPVSIPDDGLVDIVAQEITTRKAMIDAMDESEQGMQYWLDTQHYFRASAYRVEPYSPKGCFSVDGEEYPFEPFQVECHRGMATVLSPCGYYQAEFRLPDESKAS